MNTEIEVLLKKAFDAQMSGELERARELLFSILEAIPDHPQANYILGVLEVKNGTRDQALSHLSVARKGNAGMGKEWINYIKYLFVTGELDEAEIAIEVAIRARLEQNEFFADAYNNLGIKQFEGNKLKDAIGSFKKAVVLRANFAGAYNNMGAALIRERQLEDAISSLRLAVDILPNYAEARNNLGAALEQRGDIDLAMDSYKQAWMNNPEYFTPLLNYRNLCVQLLDLNETDFYGDTASTTSMISDSPKYQILAAISDFIQGDIKKVEIGLSRYHELVEMGKAVHMNRADTIFCQAYYLFLGYLIDKNPTDRSSGPYIYHFGDSHCLSYCGCKLVKGSKSYDVTSRVTFGAKAFHFSVKENTSYKAITKRNLGLINPNSVVFVSFGEIDCRYDEGFIPASKKLGKPVEEVIYQTVSAFVEWFNNENLITRHQFFFLNVPAPVYNDELPALANYQVAGVVKTYNSILKIELSNLSIGMVDVYGKTTNDTGFSNGLYHCDGHHLDHRILEHIQQQIDTVNSELL